MGREWYWTRPFRKVTGGDNGDVDHHQWKINNNNKKSKKNHSTDATTTTATSQVMGCMSGMFQLFHLHRLLFTTRSNGSSSTSDGGGGPPSTSTSNAIYHRRNTSPAEYNYTCRGVEAPRNSLELDGTNPNINSNPSISASSSIPDDYEIPFCIEVVVGKGKRKETLEEMMREEGGRDSDSSNRNVVAKLMGLESLPSSSPRMFSDDSDLRTTSFKSKRRVTVRTQLQPRNWNVMEEEVGRGGCGGTRSLPETPRMSFARRSWDSDPRLSVKTAKEFYCSKENRGGNLSGSAMQELKCIFKDYASPALKTAKVIGSPEKKRRVRNGGKGSGSGSGIGSPTRYAGEIVKQMKDSVCRRIERGRSIKDLPESPRVATRSPSISSFSPLKVDRAVEVFEKKQFSSPKLKPKPKLSVSPPPARCERASCRRFNERMKTPPSAIVTSSSSRAHPAATTTPRPPIRTYNKNPPPSLSPTSAVIKNLRQPAAFRLQPRHVAPQPVPEEFLYLKSVLKRAGIHQHTYLPLAVRWNSPSHPLDPIIFHQLELDTAVTVSSCLQHRCNRKLLFDLINEILAEILCPYFISHPHRRRLRFERSFPAGRRCFDSGTLLKEVWLKMRSFPESKCEVMHDIDALVESDLPYSNIRQLLNHPAVKEEVETIFVEIEKSVVDLLLVENSTTVIPKIR